MVFVFLPPKPAPLAYPPYYPPVIQQTCGWMKENELMMSDIPWAVAWYGNRQCVWLTLNAQSEFFAINDLLKPVRALYLTPQTMDSRFLSQWVRSARVGRASFSKALARSHRERSPAQRAAGVLPGQVFRTDIPARWSTREAPDGLSAPNNCSEPNTGSLERDEAGGNDHPRPRSVPEALREEKNRHRARLHLLRAAAIILAHESKD